MHENDTEKWSMPWRVIRISSDCAGRNSKILTKSENLRIDHLEVKIYQFIS